MLERRYCPLRLLVNSLALERSEMDQKMVFVVPLVTQAITSEWYVPNSEVEKAVRQFRFLKALHFRLYSGRQYLHSQNSRQLVGNYFLPVYRLFF